MTFGSGNVVSTISSLIMFSPSPRVKFVGLKIGYKLVDKFLFIFALNIYSSVDIVLQ